jgi:GcrA cell cycle regulator
MNGNTWSDKRTDLLKQLWAEGFSGSVIADRLHVTRNAVIGKVHRLGLPHRAVRHCRPPNNHKQRGPYRPRRSFGASPPAPNTAPSESFEPVIFEPVTLLDAGRGQCRWMQGNDRMCCGRQIQRGSSYCPSHHADVWKPTPPRQRQEARP